jgi:osmotically inducible protein OsmC
VTAVASLERADSGIRVSAVDLTVRGRVPGLDEPTFQEVTRAAEQACPISNAIRNNVEIRVQAQLEGS